MKLKKWIIKKIKENRKVREIAEASGLTTQTVTNLINESYSPIMNTVTKFIDWYNTVFFEEKTLTEIFDF